MKPSERIRKRSCELDLLEVDRTRWLVTALLEFIDEHADVFTAEPEEREASVEVRAVTDSEVDTYDRTGEFPKQPPIPEGAEEMRDEPKERKDGDALEVLKRRGLGVGYYEELRLAILAERARHAEEVGRLKAMHEKSMGIMRDSIAHARKDARAAHAQIIDRPNERFSRAAKAEVRAEKAEARVKELEEYLAPYPGELEWETPGKENHGESGFYAAKSAHGHVTVRYMRHDDTWPRSDVGVYGPIILPDGSGDGGGMLAVAQKLRQRAEKAETEAAELRERLEAEESAHGHTMARLSKLGENLNDPQKGES